MVVSLWRNLWCLSVGKINFILHVFVDIFIAKILSTCCFWYFEHVWLLTLKVILSSCRKLLCLSAGKKNFVIHFFRKILQFRESCEMIWLTAFWPRTQDPEFCQILWWNINNNVSFYLRLFPRKTNMIKFFKKSKKPFLGAILGSFCSNFVKINFPGKKGSVSF